MTKKRRLNILYVYSGYKPAYRMGGPIVSISAAAEALVSRGHKVTVFATNSNLDRNLEVPVNQPVMVDGVEVWYFKRYEPLKSIFPFIKYLSQSVGFLYSPQLAYEVKKQIKHFDLIHAHTPFVYPTIASAKIANAVGLPVFLSLRGATDPERIKHRRLKKRLFISMFLRPLINKNTFLIALTNAERENYCLLKLNAPCRVIPNGINTKEYLQNYDKNILHSLKINEDKKVILFLGRLHPIKGADLLLDAFIQIAAQIPQAILVMAGPDECDLQNAFKKKVRDNELSDRVLFPGMVTGTTKLNLLARADVFCLPSVAEGFSNAVLEAMASVTPVMISPGCHFGEVEAENAGLVVERDLEKWMSALYSLLGNPAKLVNMGRNAFDLVEKKYAWLNVVSQLEETYREGIEGLNMTRTVSKVATWDSP